MRLHRHRDLTLLTSQTLSRPGIDDRVLATVPGGELRHVTEDGGHGPLRLQRVHHGDDGSVGESAGPEFGGVGGVERPHLTALAPIVRSRGGAVDGILVEREQVFVEQDVDVGLAEVGQVRADEERRFHQGPEREVRAAFLFGQIAVADFKPKGDKTVRI